MEIRILNIMNYMSCPPNSGGLLRILGPLYKMPLDSGIRFDILFSTYNSTYARKNEEALKRIPVVDRAVGVVCRGYMHSYGGMPSGMPLDVWETMSEELLDRASEMAGGNRYDIIQIEHSQMSWIVPALRLASPESAFVLDSHNVEHMVYARWREYVEGDELERVEARRAALREWELKVWRWYDAAFTVSAVEEGLLREGGVEDVYVVPTGGGVDIGKYAPAGGREETTDLLYIGTMNWFPNAQGLVWFIDEALPLIREKRPGTGMVIVGSGQPAPHLLEACKSHNVKFVGFQKDDVAFFHRSKVFVVPLWIGAGARVKILTAWAAGIPVVSTTFGAEGLGAVDGNNIRLADDPAAFAEAVLGLLGDPGERERISRNASEHVLGYSSDRCVNLLVDAYREIAARRRSRGRLRPPRPSCGRPCIC